MRSRSSQQGPDQGAARRDHDRARIRNCRHRARGAKLLNHGLKRTQSLIRLEKLEPHYEGDDSIRRAIQLVQSLQTAQHGHAILLRTNLAGRQDQFHEHRNFRVRNQCVAFQREFLLHEYSRLCVGERPPGTRSQSRPWMPRRSP